MPDWTNLVRERLASCSKVLGAQEGVVAELAAHLEETYDGAISQGLTNAAAIELALREVQDWNALAADICRTKSKGGPMNYRTKTLWLPGMVTLLGASLLLALTQFLGAQPRVVWMGKFAMVLYWHWLVGLPLFGALGAYLSQQATGPLRARLGAALTPVLVMLLAMFLILPGALLIDGFSSLIFASFVIGLTNWVALPGIALLVGATPFLKEPQPKQALILEE